MLIVMNLVTETEAHSIDNCPAKGKGSRSSPPMMSYANGAEHRDLT